MIDVPDKPDPWRRPRREMVDTQIRARGIRDAAVLEAMELVPRERFVLPDCAARAFEDKALGIDEGQTISQPFMVAAMTAELRLSPEHRVLEIGTGSGYQTAVLACIAAHVITIERVAPLQAKAKELLDRLGFRNIDYHVGDGTLGWPDHSPFDRILVTAGAPRVPDALVDQLAEDGRLVIPVGGQTEQTLTVVERRSGRIVESPGFACRFVRLIGDQGWHQDPV